MPQTSQVRANTLLGFAQFMNNRGVAADPLLHSVGLTARDVDSEDHDLPFNLVAELMEAASQACGDPAFGVTFAKEYPVGGMGVLAFLLLNSRTVEDAMRTFVRFSPLIKSPFKFSFVNERDGASIRWRLVDEVTHGYKQIYLFGAALLILRLRQVIASDWVPSRVEMQLPRLSASDLAGVFGPNVVYDAPHYSVHVDSATLQREIPQAAPALRAILERVGEKEIAGVFPPDDKLVAAVRTVILGAMGQRRLSLEAVAQDMNYSARALQSRLAALGTSYEEVLNEVRRVRAEELLKISSHSMTDIALQLGFSELSAFTRASQRWFGRPPSAQRRYYLKVH